MDENEAPGGVKQSKPTGIVECGNCGEGYPLNLRMCPGCCGAPGEDLLDYDQLDAGVRETVRLLRLAGFETVDSGDGAASMGGTPRPWPKMDEGHVVVKAEPGEVVVLTDRLARYLADYGLRPSGLPPEGYPGLEADEVVIEASYNPAEGVAIIIVSHVLDRMWRDAEPGDRS